ncbi:MAG: MerR family transcriptional regulator [Candidatus Omnitrophica bacterium]|nr:MerR family transcriptional regulator [Candidatus Omnitrophota bacterium]
MVKNLFKIGEVMEYAGLSRQVIHNYTQLELIYEAKRTPSGHRLYGKEVFERLKKIKRFQLKGRTLLEIKKMLNGAK